MAYCDVVWGEPPEPDGKVIWAIIGVAILLTVIQFFPNF